MFNRSIEVKLAKPAKDETTSQPSTANAHEYVQLIRELAVDAAKGMAIIVGSYIAADTARQVIVNRTKK